ncbi:MAG: hypothetical protein GXZ03_05265 [Proteiniphilum sp.]|nr:hypothetical protein [Proteiniphilum sp.]
MSTPKLNIQLSDNFLTKSVVDTDINILPFPLAMYLSLTHEVYINELAKDILEISEEKKLDARKLFNANTEIFNISKETIPQSISNKYAKLVLPNNKEIGIIYSYNTLQDNTLGTIYFITFTKKEIETPTDSVFSMSLVKDEISKLKDNLNNEGKSLLNDILKQYFNKDQKQLSLEDLVNYEKELQIIQKEFPVLSRREVLLCGLLVHDMDLGDIATMTNRSLNSIFVTIHRINKKTDISNKNELTKVLQKLIMESRSSD